MFEHLHPQKDAEDALQLALPALEAARLALDDLDKNDVTEIRYAINVTPYNIFKIFTSIEITFLQESTFKIISDLIK